MKYLSGIILWFVLAFLSSCHDHEKITIIVSDPGCERIQYGSEKLAGALQEAGYQLSRADTFSPAGKGITIVIGEIKDSLITQLASENGISLINLSAREGYTVKSVKNLIIIAGSDATGTLYGCMELRYEIERHSGIPEKVDITDQPEMVIRGTCIGLQKTVYLPGRHVYEYPYTPDNFPWFYEKDLWIQYLDMLVENHMNALFLWNGHPFASLVKLEYYPYAVEVDDETFRMNEEIFSFLTREADKRGIWIIQMFYNIIVSKPFAEYHGIETQDRSRLIIPVIADYTRKSIAAFIEKYPNVGLMVCLGEAINTIEDDIEWFTQTIIPGVKDGLSALGITEEPPIILRGHDTDARRVMEAALPIYKNLYTTHKYNGESLTTYQPRGSWAEIHQGLSSLGSIHISNVHIMANLEPFRYGSPDFIQKSVRAMHDIQGANGLHLYPQSSYWDWPYTADKTTPRLLQIDRDWIWYKAWSRYAWNCRRDRSDEIEFWTDRLNDHYNCGKHAINILTAYEETGEIAPKLLRRFGISDGNRQTLMLGMFMSQLVNPYKWNVYRNFYNSNGPEGEILIEYAEKEWKKEQHTGETPPQIIAEVVEHGRRAREAIDRAAPYVKSNRDEFFRLKNDVYCYEAFAHFFQEKVNAAMLVLRYKYSDDLTDLEKALPHLEHSIEYYSQLVELTKDAYLYANSMQTRQRRIPVTGEDGRNKTWAELLPLYQEELEKFRENLDRLKSPGDTTPGAYRVPLIPADVTLLSEGLNWYPLKKDQKIYSDRDFLISDLVGELENLKGLRLSYEEQLNNGTSIRFRNNHPVKVVVGYFNGHSYSILAPPALETDARANERGQAEIRIANALEIRGLYPVNIYTYYFEPGENLLKLDKGIVLILGFVDGHQDIPLYDAGIGISGSGGIDWLFY